MTHALIDLIFGSKYEKDIAALLPLVRQINEREGWAMTLSDDQFPEWTKRLKERVQGGETLDDLLPESFALVREVARRKLGERLYDVQLMGGIVLHQGKIMEMKTGEGKTVSSVTAAYLNALAGKGVHIVTVNDYLAQRDAEWMRPIYTSLGVSVGFILSRMENAERRAAYSCDITYGTNNELGFDYLRDNMSYGSDLKAQQGHHFCIIDEIDSILVDESRTPLIISGSTRDDVSKYAAASQLAKHLIECEKDPESDDYPEEPVGDYKLEEKNRRISFTDEGLNHIEAILQRSKVIKTSLFSNENFEYIHHFTQALRAQHLYRLDRDYVIKDGQVQIVDEFTGRILQGRRYSEGLHQAIEAKEGIRIAERNRTLATITLQNFFRMYEKISGMTGTAETEAKEFGNIYGLEVVVVPTNRPIVRNDDDDLIYIGERQKYNAICQEIEEAHRRGQPVLVGTISIERSEMLADMLTRRGIRHEVLNAKNHAREAMIIAEAGAKGAATIATNMAGRGTDIKLGGNPEFRARSRAGTDASPEEYRRCLRQELEIWETQYRAVRESGGLYVLGTERHESRRIDNQLRGRSGRQGDAGQSRFFLSMDDDLMRLFGRGGERVKAIMSRGMDDDEALNHRLINSSIERAQRRVEERNFDIRKHLLEYDDVVNEQRKLIYAQRNAILEDGNLTERIITIGQEFVAHGIASFNPIDEPAKMFSFLQILRETMLFSPSAPAEELARLDADEAIGRIGADMRASMLRKAEVIGMERFNLTIRYEYLRNIDLRWQDHLENLESLREAVYLRSYGQRNPLLEYKLEGFQIFDKLIQDIRITVGRRLFAVRTEDFEVQRDALRIGGGATMRHRQLQVFGERGASGAARPTVRPTVDRAAPAQSQTINTKVGRNDPCPCGSGKKYKFCHGK